MVYKTTREIKMARYGLWIHRLTLLCVLYISMFSTSTWLPVSANGASCGDSLEPRLTVGAMGRVTPGNSNNVRAEASKTGKLLGQIPGGESFDVLDGPTCADGLNWWQVRYGDLEGWTVEAAGIDYWLEPYDPSKPEVLIPTNGIEYTYEGISFELDPALAASVTASRLAPVEDDPNYDPPSPIAPEGIAFTFADSNGNTLPFSFRVYSVDAYKKVYKFAEQYVNDLSKLLADDSGWTPPAGDEDIPLLAEVVPPMLMRARINKVQFANGSGYQFLAEYSFDVHEIINPLQYYFSGLTCDLQYYVIAESKVSTPLLADKVTQHGLDFEKKFESYRSEVIKTIKNAKPEEFMPNLSLLAGLMRTLRIHGPSFKVTTENEVTHVQYENIRFDVPSAFAKDVDYKISPANWVTMNAMPEHVCFSAGISLCIIPTEGMDWYVKGLNPFLKDKPPLTVADEITSIPTPTAGVKKLIYAQVRYLDNDVLHGVRFLTSYAQMDYPIGDKDLYYNFSGLTRGGKYIIFLEAGADTTVLADANHSNAQMATINANPVKYYQSIIDKLNPASSTDFNPNLEMLDAIIQSIHIQ